MAKVGKLHHTFYKKSTKPYTLEPLEPLHTTMNEHKRESPIYVFSFTAFDHLESPDYYTNWCKKWGKHWTFQLEEGTERKTQHYQGIISLKTKRRLHEFLKLLRDEDELGSIHIRPTANTNVKGGTKEFYVTKPDGRLGGPWSDKDEIKFFGWDIEEFKDMRNLYPWQAYIYNQREHREKRTVNVIYDPKGDHGKSTFARLMEAHKHAIILNTSGDSERMAASLCDELMGRENRDPKMIIIDLKRSANQKNPHALFETIESIKDGRVCDTRYHYRKWIFHPPQVWVFCNRLPDDFMLTHNRWKIWEIADADHSLVPLTRTYTNGSSSGASLSRHIELPTNNNTNFNQLEPLEPNAVTQDYQYATEEYDENMIDLDLDQHT